MSRSEEFHAFRARLNERILEKQPEGVTPTTLGIKRFFSLDTKCYEDGALSAKAKEGLGLSASLVLRCDDCIAYHVDQCVKLGWSDEELMEVFEVGLVVGGSIVIPHLRRAIDFLDELRSAGS